MNSLSNNPKVSIIMPVYNAEKFIRKAVESICSQTYSNLEILIADDGSKDSSKQVVESINDDRIRYCHNKINLGYLKTCNNLFELSTGDLVTFQDADDYSDSKRIEIQVNRFRNDIELGMCGTFHINVNEHEIEIGKVERPQEYSEIEKEMKKRYQFCGATMMIRREVLDDVGFYRNAFDRITGEDYDLGYRIIEKYKSVNIPEFLYFYRHYSYDAKSGWDNNIRFLKNHKIVHFLANQRSSEGRDCIQAGKPEELEEFLSNLDKQFENDSAYFLRNQGHVALQQKRYTDTLRFAAKAIVTDPVYFRNYKNFVFCGYVIIRRVLNI